MELPIIVRQSDFGSLNANSYFASRKAHGQRVIMPHMEARANLWSRKGSSQALDRVWAPVNHELSS